MLNVTDSLVNFRKTSVLQKGILSFLINLMATEDELEELGNIFKKFDVSNDGFITIEEL